MFYVCSKNLHCRYKNESCFQQFLIFISVRNKKHSRNQRSTIGARVDVSKIPFSWIGEFTKNEYSEVLVFNEETNRWAFSPDYGDALQDKLSERNDVCVLRVTKRQPIQPGDKDFPNKQFFAAYADCTGDYCSARYSFTIKTIPDDTTNVKMLIK